VVSAGSFMHFLIAFVLLFVLLAVVGAPNDNTTTVGSLTRFPSATTPAQQAGLKLGDHITALDGRKVSKFSDLRDFIVSHADEPIDVSFQRHGRAMTATVTPVDLVRHDIKGVDVVVPNGQTHYGFVGIGPAVVGERVGPLRAIGEAGDDFGSTVTSVFSALGQVFSTQGLNAYTSQITGHVSAQKAATQPRFSSVVGIVYLAHDAADSGLRDVLGLLIELNIFIGIFNLFPLLPLDGGHVATAVYERLRSRKGRRYRADMAKWAPVTALVILFLIIIGLASIWADIFHPPANPFQ
jgi:membrane-associated protease RseP (regulator of RpoE activity)